MSTRVVDDPPSRKALQPEVWAAVTNGLVVLAAPLLVVAAARLIQEERAVAVAWVSGPPPNEVAAWLSSTALAVLPASPFAAIAAWRTHAIARRWRLRTCRVWRGVAEAAMLGAIPATFLLPIVTSRGLAGVGYAAAYALLGAIVGTAFGLVLTATALIVLRTAPRPASVASLSRSQPTP